MTVAAVIPARYASTRLPGKPLLVAGGKQIIQHVWERVARSRAVERVLVATDDERIRDAVAAFGGEAVLTRPDHPSGTDRVHEAAAGLRPRPRVVLNVQGDEPDVDPADLDALVALLGEHPDADIATLAVPLDDPGDASLVKVVVDRAGRALYFSRAAVPHFRDGGGRWLGHMGVYAFRWAGLEAFVRHPAAPLEEAEKLEQNRALWWGMTVVVGRAARLPLSIDTRQDYETFSRRWERT